MTAQRELTLSKNELIHPERVGDALTWVPGRGLDALADELREFDPRLTLAFHGLTKRWELWRLDHGTYNLVCRSRPGLPFPGDLLSELKARDSRSGYNPHEAVEAHNAKVDAARQATFDEANGAGADKLCWALRKDIGHLYG